MDENELKIEREISEMACACHRRADLGNILQLRKGLPGKTEIIKLEEWSGL